MTPKHKAEELVDRFRPYAYGPTPEMETNNAKRCAGIFVEEIIALLETLHKPEYTAFIAKHIYTIDGTEYNTHIQGYELLDYFKKVKREIKKIKL
jgi:hypothetical protein